VLLVLEGTGCSIAADRDIFPDDFTLLPPVGRGIIFTDLQRGRAFTADLGGGVFIGIGNFLAD
jgi:hypothetical protein